MPPSPSDEAKGRIRAQFGRAADAYVTSDVHAQGESLHLLVELVKPERTWTALDVATGAGHTALVFAPHVGRVVASDLTTEMLAATEGLARRRGVANLETRVADAESLPYPDDHFDLVTCRLAFHHFPHPEAAVRELARVLRRGGRLGFTDNVVVEDAAAAAYYNAFERLRDPSHHEVLSLAGLVSRLEVAGLRVESVRGLAKELEFQDWADRMHVVAADKARLLDMLRAVPPALVPLLAPRFADGTAYFTLWEAVLVARKLG